MVFFLPRLRYKGWQIDVVIDLCFSLVVCYGEKRRQGWVVKECKMLNGQRRGWRWDVCSVVSLKTFRIALLGLTLKLGHLVTAWEWIPQNSSGAAFRVCLETEHQGCNHIGYCYSACSLSLSLFCPLTLSLSESLNYGELSHLAHLGHCKFRCCLLFWRRVCKWRRARKYLEFYIMNFASSD